MATKKVGKLQIELEALTQQFSQQIAKAKTTNDKLSRSFKRSKSAAGAMSAQLKNLGMMLASGIGARALINFGREAIQMGDDLAKASRRIGFSVESLQALQFEAKAGGFEVEQLHKALTKFSTGVGEVATLGTGEFKGTLEKLGIHLRDASGDLREIDDLLVEFAQKAMDASTSIERLTYVGEAFGLRGTKMIQILPLIAQGMDAVKASSLDFGAIVSDNEILALEQTQDALDRLTKTYEAWQMRTLGGLAIDLGFGTEISEAARKVENLRFELSQVPANTALSLTLEIELEKFERALAAAEAFQADIKRFSSQPIQGPAPFPIMGPAQFDGGVPDWMTPEGAARSADAWERASEVWQSDLSFDGEFLREARGQFDDLREQALSNADAFERMLEAQDSAVEFQANKARQLETAVLSVATAFENQLVSAIMSGKFSFQDFARSALASLAQIITRMMILKTVEKGLGWLRGGGDAMATSYVSPGHMGALEGPGFGASLLQPRGLPSRLSPALSELSVSVPLSRSATVSGPVSVTVNNAAPHSEEESQKIGALVKRAVSSAWREQALNESRPGGLLNPATG